MSKKNRIINYFKAFFGGMQYMINAMCFPRNKAWIGHKPHLEHQRVVKLKQIKKIELELEELKNEI